MIQRTKTVYVCESCGAEYEEEKDAHICEISHVFWVDEIFHYAQCLVKRHPELRVGQVIIRAARAAGWVNNDLFYCPDDTLLEGIRTLWTEENDG